MKYTYPRKSCNKTHIPEHQAMKHTSPRQQDMKHPHTVEPKDTHTLEDQELKHTYHRTQRIEKCTP